MKKLLIGLAALALVSPVAAQDTPPAVDLAQDRVARFLELDDAQVQQWDDLLAARADAVDPLRQDLEATLQELSDLLGSDSPDPTRVGELTIIAHDLRQDLGQAHADYAQGFEQMLDVEQAERLGFVRRAERVQPVIPSFQVMGLVGGGGSSRP